MILEWHFLKLSSQALILFIYFLFSQEDDGYEIQEGDEGFQRYLYEHYDACPETVEGGKGAFIVGESSKMSIDT